jgi:hypothetical protein
MEVRMSKLVDCPSCGGLVPAGQRCCPHCHCRYSRWRRFVLLASAALGLAGCGNEPVVHYGGSPFPPGTDFSVTQPGPDMAMPRDLSHEGD